MRTFWSAVGIMLLLSAPAWAQNKYISQMTAVGAVASTDTFQDCATNGCSSSTASNQASAAQLSTFMNAHLPTLANGHFLGNATGSPAAAQDTTLASGSGITIGCSAGTCTVSATGSGTVTSIATTAPLSGGTITTSGTLSLTGPSNLTTFTGGTVPMGAGTSAFAASEITDVAAGGVVIGSPTGGQKGAGTLNMTGCFINNVACATSGGGGVTWPANGDIVISNGTSAPAGLAPVNNDLAYGSGGAWAALASANNAVLVTGGTGVPSLATTLPSGLTAPSLTVTGGFTATGLVTNADLANSSVTIGSTAVSLGGTAATVAGLTLTAPTINGGALSGTLSGTPTISGNLTFSGVPNFTGLATGTQVSCLGLTSGNVLALSSGACGTGGGSTTITLAAGLGNSATSYNSGAQTVTNGSAIFPQLIYQAVTTSCTMDSTCSSGTNDQGHVLTATAASVTMTTPNPTTSGIGVRQTGYDGTHPYSLTTPSGTIYGCGTSGATVSGLTYAAQLFSDGTGWQCIPNSSSVIPLPISWLPGQNLSAASLPVSNISKARTVLAVTCTPEVLVGGTATIDVWMAPSGTALASGTKINTTSCNANTGATTDQSMGVTNAAIPTGDRVGIVATGAGWASSAGSGVVTLTIQ